MLILPFETDARRYFLAQAASLGQQFHDDLNAARLEFRQKGLLASRGCLAGTDIWALIGGESVRLVQAGQGKWTLFRIYPDPLKTSQSTP